MKSADGKAECLHCGGAFWPRRRGHVFCSSWFRHRGERRETPGPVVREQVARLFDESRTRTSGYATTTGTRRRIWFFMTWTGARRSPLDAAGT